MIEYDSKSNRTDNNNYYEILISNSTGRHIHSSDVTWEPRRINQAATERFVKQFPKINKKKYALNNPHNWPFVRGSNRWSVDSPHKEARTQKVCPWYDFIVIYIRKQCDKTGAYSDLSFVAPNTPRCLCASIEPPRVWQETHDPWQASCLNLQWGYTYKEAGTYNWCME